MAWKTIPPGATVALGAIPIALLALVVIYSWPRATVENGLARESGGEDRATVRDSVRIPLDFRKIDFAFDEEKIRDIDGADARGLIAPHHLPAQSWIAEGFAALKVASPEPSVIVLLSPNHWEKGDAVITADARWIMPDGTVEPDDGRVKQLNRKLGIGVDNQSAKDEHGVYSLLPFAHHFFPGVPVVPVMFRYDVSQSATRSLSDLLATWIGEGALIVASVDFSHYLSYEQSKAYDAATLQAIRERDYPFIKLMRSEYLDSPAVLTVFLRSMDLAGYPSMHVLEHGNSGSISGREYAPTTSYFVSVFSKEE
jgi:AmmeMemoRadiSam system protein B